MIKMNLRLNSPESSVFSNENEHPKKLLTKVKPFYTDFDSLVLDPFAGSNTAGKAAETGASLDWHGTRRRIP
jgi:hypothetical protein